MFKNIIKSIKEKREWNKYQKLVETTENNKCDKCKGRIGLSFDSVEQGKKICSFCFRKEQNSM